MNITTLVSVKEAAELLGYKPDSLRQEAVRQRLGLTLIRLPSGAGRFRTADVLLLMAGGDAEPVRRRAPRRKAEPPFGHQALATSTGAPGECC